MTTLETFKRARNRSVPIIAIENLDPTNTVRWTCKALNGKGDTAPIILWDAVRGVIGLNDPGNDYAQKIQPDFPLTNIVEMLSKIAQEPPADTLCFVSNAHRYIEETPVLQAVWNCRDVFKSRAATLVLLGVSFKLPPELTQDCVILSEELPDKNDLEKILDSVLKDAKEAGLTANAVSINDRPRIIDTLRGMSAFSAEQITALSTDKKGIDTESLWNRKVKQVEQTDGLSVYRGKETFSDVGGLANAKKTIGKTISGKLNISCLVLLDELDKAMSASGSDTSGTTQDQNKVLLSYMQDNNVLGCLFLGPPGTGKTMLCKSAANEHKIPLIMLDLGAMKGSLVGQSEQRMRQAMQIIHAVSDGRALFIGACNRTENLPPELRRRFNYTSMFFDLPDQTERQSIWKVCKSDFKIEPAQCDDVQDDGYTGAEIRNCCLKSWAMDCKLSEASKTIVPIAKSAADIVEALRKGASNKYISASNEGFYKYAPTIASTARKMELA